MFSSPHDDNQKAYGEGANDAQQAGLLERFAHGAGDHFSQNVQKSEEQKSYEAGWHDEVAGRVRWVERPSNSEQSSSRSKSRSNFDNSSAGYGGSSSSSGDSTTPPSSFIVTSLIVTVVLYPIVGFAGCMARLARPMPPVHHPEHNVWIYSATDSYTAEAIYIPLGVLAVIFLVKTVSLLTVNAIIRLLLIAAGLVPILYLEKSFFDKINWSLTANEPANYSQTTAPQRAKVIKNKANLRSTPNDKRKPLKQLNFDDSLILLSPNYVGRGWYHVRDASGQEGWVHGDTIKFE